MLRVGETNKDERTGCQASGFPRSHFHACILARLSRNYSPSVLNTLFEKSCATTTGNTKGQQPKCCSRDVIVWYMAEQNTERFKIYAVTITSFSDFQLGRS